MEEKDKKAVWDIRPRCQEDYIAVLGWMVSRRLLIVISILLIVISVVLIYLVKPISFPMGELGDKWILTYSYDSLPLKIYQGKVRILAKDGHLAYKGDVSSGYAQGTGILYQADGKTLYQGQFERSMYNGKGILYNPNGTIRYEGDFTDNIPDGEGISYREDGSKEYAGEHQKGIKTGEGELYNTSGNKIFAGNLKNGKIRYEEYLGRPTKELEEKYFGAAVLYTMHEEFAEWLSDLGVMYYSVRKADALEEEWTIEEFVILSNVFPVEKEELSEISEIENYFNQTSYQGNTRLLFYEAVGMELLGESIRIEKKKNFDTVYEVLSYEIGTIVLYVFEKDDIRYTFYSKVGDSHFFMYAIAKI